VNWCDASQQLQIKYGNSFEHKNVIRMRQFAARFPDFEIVVPLAHQLSWSHFIALLPLESDEAFLYYAQDAISRGLGKRELRNQIARKAYERREISNLQLTEGSAVPFNMFKDPYLLDVMGLHDNYLVQVNPLHRHQRNYARLCVVQYASRKGCIAR